MASSSKQLNMIAASIVLAGAALSFAISVVPHFGSAHQLLALPFGLGIALYGIYGIIAALQPSSLANPLGLRILGLNLVMGIALRSAIAPSEVEEPLSLVAVLLIGYALADTYLRSRTSAPARA